MKIFSVFVIVAVLLLTTACDNEAPEQFDYAETGLYGDNVLFLERTVLTKRENSLYCKLPAKQSLSITITGKNSSMGGSTPDGAISMPSGIWYYDPTTTNNWAIMDFDKKGFRQTFTSID